MSVPGSLRGERVAAYLRLFLHAQSLERQLAALYIVGQVIRPL